MADGELKLTLADATLRRLTEAAQLAGVPVESYAADALTRALQDDDGLAEDLRRIAEYERTGESMSIEEAMQHFDNALEKRLAAKR